MIKKFLKDCWTLWVPFVLIILFSIPIYIYCGYNSAYCFNTLGTLSVVVCNFVYILFFLTAKSKLSTGQKLIKMLTFKKL